MKKSLNLNYSTDNLFSIPVHCIQIRDFDTIKDKLIKYSYDLTSRDNVGRNSSNRGGWQSQSFPINGGDVLQDLLISVISNIPSFKTGIDVKCDAWVNISPSGAFNAKHCHPTCDIAGVLWIKIPENSGDFIFISPYDFVSFNEMHSYTEKFKKQTNYYHNYSYKPQEGGIILFPSHLQHRVDVNESDEDRISASFNIELLNVEY